MNKYRVAYNGYEYRVELQYFTLFRHREKWIPVKRECAPLGLGYTPTFYTRSEAEGFMQECEKQQAKLFAEWKPV